MSQRGKWIKGIALDGSVANAARLSLDARLSAVTHWLPLAAEQAEDDIECVHRLRVSTRRAVAALGLYTDWVPGRSARWLKKRLRKIRRAAGNARDLDVLAERLQRELGPDSDGLLKDVARRRSAAQPAIVEIHERCSRKGRLQHKITKLLEGVGPRGEHRDIDPPPFRDWAVQELRAEADQFFAAMPDDQFEPAALHQFRIRGKALRYGIELLAPAFGPEMRSEHYPVVEDLQERLGRINDHVIGAEHLRQWSGAMGDAKHQRLLLDTIEREQAQLAEALDAFRHWWTPERAAALRAGLTADPVDESTADLPPSGEQTVADSPAPR